MPFLNLGKFHEDPVKKERDKPRTEVSVTDTTHRDGYYNTILEALKNYDTGIKSIHVPTCI